MCVRQVYTEGEGVGICVSGRFIVRGCWYMCLRRLDTEGVLVLDVSQVALY